jgi:hypothetical protein
MLRRQKSGLTYVERQAGSKSADVQQSPQNKVRNKLREAGLLASPVIHPDELDYADESEQEVLAVMREGARPSEELIAEDRGD